MTRGARFRSLGVACVGGACFALSSPPTNFYPLIVIGLALLAIALADAPTAWRAFGRAAAWGTVAGLVGLRFVPAVILRFTSLGKPLALLALVLLAAAQSLVWAIGALVGAIAMRRFKAPLELGFAIVVFVASSLPTIFAWTPAGLFSPWPALVQLADLIGERGVSAILGVVAALLARASLAALGLRPGASLAFAAAPSVGGARRAKVLRPIAASVAVLVALVAYGALRMRSIARASADLPRIKIALVDQSVGPEERWIPKNHPAILSSLRKLTNRAEAQGAELTVWPEAAYPYVLDHDATRAPRSGPAALVGGLVRGPLLAGLITRAPPETIDGHVENNSFNSATLVMPDGTMQPSYDKLQLLWFGEMVPLGQELPWLRRIFQKSGGLIPGKEARSLTLARADKPLVTMAVLNCYEDTLPNAGVRLARELEPNLLVNVTNDAWFFGTAEPELHARLATMRAIELRRDLVRAVNMGVATWVDASGEVRARYDGADADVLFAEPAIRDGSLTLHAVLGDGPTGGALLLLVLVLFVRGRGKASPIDDEPPTKKSETESTRVEESKPAEEIVAPSPDDGKNDGAA